LWTVYYPGKRGGGEGDGGGESEIREDSLNTGHNTALQMWFWQVRKRKSLIRLIWQKGYIIQLVGYHIWREKRISDVKKIGGSRTGGHILSRYRVRGKKVIGITRWTTQVGPPKGRRETARGRVHWGVLMEVWEKAKTKHPGGNDSHWTPSKRGGDGGGGGDNWIMGSPLLNPKKKTNPKGA